MASLSSWLPVVRAAAVGWTPVIHRSLPVLTCHHSSRVIDKRVTLNVSGRRFQISRRLLDARPDTLLGSDEKEFFYDSERSEYMFDRDPRLFRLILVYYQTGRLHYSPRHVRVILYCPRPTSVCHTKQGDFTTLLATPVLLHSTANCSSSASRRTPWLTAATPTTKTVVST